MISKALKFSMEIGIVFFHKHLVEKWRNRDLFSKALGYSIEIEIAIIFFIGEF